MLSAHRISPQALHGYYESYGIKSDTLDRILLDPFLIILEMFVTINTPIGERGSVVVKANATRLEVAGSRLVEVKYIYYFFNIPSPFGRTRQWVSLSI
jgi:hypothetical protein